MKILCISLWTPPIVRPQSILIFKMIPEWIRQGVKPVILTYEECGKWDIDLEVYTIPMRKELFFSPVFKFIQDYKENKYYKEIIDIAYNIIVKKEIEIVFSFSNPQISNLLGAKLKQLVPIKFISHFSDPFVDNPLKKFNKRRFKKVLREEEYIILNSDRIVFTNEIQKSLVMKKYSSDQLKLARVIPHCFDRKLYNYSIDRKLANNDKVIFSYIGALYKDRNLDILLNALNKIKNENRDIFNKIKLQLVGVESDYTNFKLSIFLKKLNSLELIDNVDIIPTLGYLKSLEYMITSDCLIVIDANLENSPFLPSKLIDYIGSGKYVIGITPENSPTYLLLKEMNCSAFTYYQEGELKVFIKDYIKNKKKYLNNINRMVIDHYNVEATTQRLLNIFRETLNN